MNDTGDRVAQLTSQLDTVSRRLALFESLFLCKRCGSIGHDREQCIAASGFDAAVDTDAFSTGVLDLRIGRAMPEEMWREVASWLPAKQIVQLVRINEFFCHVVWGKHADVQLWRRVGDIDAEIVHIRGSPKYSLLTAAMRPYRPPAPNSHILTLIAGRANPNVFCDRRPVLNLACRRGRIDIVRALIGAGAQFDRRFDYMHEIVRAPTTVAASLAVLELVVACPRADVDHVYNERETALATACRTMAKLEHARVLVKAGADIHRVVVMGGRSAVDTARMINTRAMDILLRPHVKVMPRVRRRRRPRPTTHESHE